MYMCWSVRQDIDFFRPLTHTYTDIDHLGQDNTTSYFAKQYVICIRYVEKRRGLIVNKCYILH